MAQSLVEVPPRQSLHAKVMASEWRALPSYAFCEHDGVMHSTAIVQYSTRARTTRFCGLALVKVFACTVLLKHTVHFMDEPVCAVDAVLRSAHTLTHTAFWRKSIDVFEKSESWFHSSAVASIRQ